jgi:hypothetical protein
MRLCIPEPARPGVTLARSELHILSLDIEAWQRRTLGPDRAVVRTRERTETTTGWPVTLIRSDEVDGDGDVVAHRLHAFYTLLDHGCVVSVVGDLESLDAARASLLAADVDWATDELLALVQLWQS